MSLRGHLPAVCLGCVAAIASARGGKLLWQARPWREAAAQGWQTGTPGPPLLRVGDNATARSELRRRFAGCSSSGLCVAGPRRHASKAGVSENDGELRDQNHCGGGPGRAAAGCGEDVEDEVRAQEPEEEAIALEVVVVNVRA